MAKEKKGRAVDPSLLQAQIDNMTLFDQPCPYRKEGEPPKPKVRSADNRYEFRTLDEKHIAHLDYSDRDTSGIRDLPSMVNGKVLQ